MKWLRERAITKGDCPFINGITYKEVLDRLESLASHLAAAVEGTKRVGLLSENSVEMAILIGSLSALGKEIVFLNTLLTSAEIQEQLEVTEASVLLVSDSLYGKVKDLSRKNRQIECITLSQIISLEKSSWNYVEHPILGIMNTSATTGKFKSVPLGWKQIEAHVQASAKSLGVEDNDNWLIVLPLFHVSGLSILMRSLYNGTAVTIRPKFDEKETIDLLNRKIVIDERISKNPTDISRLDLHPSEIYRPITMVSLVPTVLQRIVEQIETDHLRVILLGGEFIPLPLLKRCVDLQLPVYKSYGMSETFGQSVSLNVLDMPHKMAAAGKPLEGVRIEIRNTIEEGIGEIWIDSPMVMPGYLHKDPQVGPFNTDDIGYIDEDGYLYLLNRRKDIIISGGENIYPKELEDKLYSIVGVKDCVVLPMEDSTWGQIPIACVSTDEDMDLMRERVFEFSANCFPTFKRPKAIYMYRDLPRNKTGKILRQQLLEEIFENKEVLSNNL